jgi:hypothetical protein
MTALTGRMTPLRLTAIGVIFAGATFAWFTLGGTLVARTGETDSRLTQEVAQLWGGRHVQTAPSASIERPRLITEDVEAKNALGQTVGRNVTQKTVIDQVPVSADSSRIDVRLALDQRRKGLLWYDTYAIAFEAHYRFTNPDDEARPMVVHFHFPSAQAIYDGFVFEVNGQRAAAATDLKQGQDARVLVAPHGQAVVRVVYRSRGLDDWAYAFAESGVAHVDDFTLTARTDFAKIDFPPGTISPTEKAREASGWRLVWRFESLTAGQRIGVDAPARLNPGPFAARVTFFAPVGLLFFLTVLVILGVVREQNLHPMNYFFLATAFFAFHLLLAYLVDHVDVHLAFALAAATSVFLVVSYLRVVAGMRRALLEAGVAQSIFLVLFSYAFFFEGYTGLAVTVGAVLTLFVLMQITARVDWGRVFQRSEANGARPPLR